MPPALGGACFGSSATGLSGAGTGSATGSLIVVVSGGGGSGSGCVWAHAPLAALHRQTAVTRLSQRRSRRALPPDITPLSDRYAARQRYCLKLAAKLESCIAAANDGLAAS